MNVSVAVLQRTSLGRRQRTQLIKIVALLGLALFVELMFAYAASKKPMVTVALVVAVGMTALAIVRPMAIGIVALLSIALIPVYAAPQMGPIELQPAVCALWLGAFGALVAILGRDERAGISIVDVAMGAFVGSTMLSVLVGGRTPTEFAQHGFIWVGCYLGARLLMARVTDARTMFRAVALTALTVVPFVLVEAMTKQNPFFSLAFNGPESELWATAQDRLGSVRVEASFGHAIALGMFAATIAIVCVGVAIHRRRPLERWAWFGLAAVFVAAIVPTVSRTGWVVLGVGVLLLAIGTADRFGRRWIVGLIAALAALSVALSIALPNEAVSPVRLAGGGGSSVELRGSDQQRQLLLKKAFESDRLSLFGSQDEKLTASIGTGNNSVDNGYLALANSWGLVPMAAFVLVGVSLLIALLRARRSAVWGLLAVAALANFVGLMFVALITQQEYYIFALAGAAAAIDARLPIVRRPRPESAMALASRTS